MTGREFLSLSGGLLLLVLLARLGVDGSQAGTALSLPTETARFKPGSGAEIAAAQCLVCHSADYVSIQPRMSRTFWKGTVQKMQQKYGAPIPNEQVDGIVDYLVKTYGVEDPPLPKASVK